MSGVDGLPERAPGLDVHVTDEGAIVWNDAEKRVSHLNQVAVMLLELCDGSRDQSQIAAELAELFEVDDPPVDIVRKGLDQLRQDGLIDAPKLQDNTP